jgi:hypothetical protein
VARRPGCGRRALIVAAESSKSFVLVFWSLVWAARTQHAPNRPNYVIFLLRRFFFWTSNCFDLLTYKANEKNKTRPANRLVVDLLLQFAH